MAHGKAGAELGKKRLTVEFATPLADPRTWSARGNGSSRCLVEGRELPWVAKPAPDTIVNPPPVTPAPKAGTGVSPRLMGLEGLSFYKDPNDPDHSQPEGTYHRSVIRQRVGHGAKK